MSGVQLAASVWPLDTPLRNRSYTYGAAGNLAFLTFGGETTVLDRDLDQLPDDVVLPGSYHTQVRPFTSIHTPGADSLAAFHQLYYYGSLARLRAAVDPVADKQKWFGFDDLGRLDTVAFEQRDPYPCSWESANGYLCGVESTDSVQTSSYDEVGNRTDHGGAYDLGNRITGFRGCSYTYDSDGNVTSRTGCGTAVTFVWNAINQLTQTISNGDTTKYEYDAWGRLLRRHRAGPDVQYLWDRGNLFATYYAPTVAT